MLKIKQALLSDASLLLALSARWTRNARPIPSFPPCDAARRSRIFPVWTR